MPTRLTLKYLLYSLLCILLAVTQNLALLALVAMGYVFTLAIQERLLKLNANPQASLHFASGHWVSDGGSFPGHEPEEEHSAPHRPIVIDGGSLEHHQR